MHLYESVPICIDISLTNVQGVLSTLYINVPYCILIRFDPQYPLPLPPEDSDWSKVVPVETSWPSLPGSTLNPHDTLESVLGRLGLLDYYTLLQVNRHGTCTCVLYSTVCIVYSVHTAYVCCTALVFERTAAVG